MDGDKILIVDDEKKLVGLVKAYLEKEGYSTVEAYDGGEALRAWGRERPSLVVLDILMPGVDGLQFCREVRKSSNVPIIILSARSEEGDRLEGLELGADDYMTKPFSPRELVARIRAILRRRGGEADSGRRRIVEGPLVIDQDGHLVEIDGREIQLTPTEFSVLLLLASHPGRVYSREELVRNVQGDYFEGYERTVDTHIKNIRKKVGALTEDWSFIETVYGVGYRFGARRKE